LQLAKLKKNAKMKDANASQQAPRPSPEIFADVDPARLKAVFREATDRGTRKMSSAVARSMLASVLEHWSPDDREGVLDELGSCGRGEIDEDTFVGLASRRSPAEKLLRGVGLERAVVASLAARLPKDSQGNMLSALMQMPSDQVREGLLEAVVLMQEMIATLQDRSEMAQRSAGPGADKYGA